MKSSTLLQHVFSLILTAVLLGVGPAATEMLVLPEGGFMEIESYEVDGDKIRLVLPSGGQMVMPLIRVDRIIDDEVGGAAPVAHPPDSSFNLRFDPTQPKPQSAFAELIYAAARRHALNPALVEAVARTESSFDPRAVSHKGAQGLMQLMPATAKRFGLEGAEVFDPAKNLDAGTRYLKFLADKYDDRLSWVLAAYNAGEGTIVRYGGLPPYGETRNFVERVFSRLGLQPRAIDLSPLDDDSGP